jgi:hypothetical protein
MISALGVNKLSGRGWRGPTLRITPETPQDRYDKGIEYSQAKAATPGREDRQAFTAMRLSGYE